MTNPMPVDTTYGTVSFAAFQTAADSIGDVDALPQARPVTGTVRILRSVPITLYQTAPRPFTLFAGSHAYPVTDGIMVDEEGRDSVSLVATTSPGGNPPGGPGVYYTATFDLAGVPQRSPVIFTLDAGQHVDLSQAAAVPSAPGPAGIVRGRSILVIDNPPGTTNLRISYDDGTVDTIPMPPGTGTTVVADGDRGDVVVTGAGTVWTIDAAVITPAARDVLAATTADAMVAVLGAVLGTDPRLSDPRTPTAHVHAIADTTGLGVDLAARAPLASPVFTGTPTAPTINLTAGSPAVGKVWTATGADGAASWQTPAPGGGAGGSLTDGDYGDVIVSNAGATIGLDPAVVTAAARTVLDDVDTPAMLATLGAVATGDARLADNRTPTAHTHGESDVTGLPADLDSKADAVSTSNSLAALQAADTAHDNAIAGKADNAANTTAHNTLQANIDTANASIAGKAPLNSPTFTGTPVLPSPRITGGTPDTGKVWTGVGASGDGAWTALPAAPTALPPPDGDKGDLTVTSSGTVWTIGAGVITNAKMAADSVGNAQIYGVPTNTIKGRVSPLTGNTQDLTTTQVRAMLNVADGATANSPDATLLARANHTGNQSLDTTTDSATRVAMTPAERTKLAGAVAINSQAGAYTLALADDGKAVQTTSAAAVAVTVPLNSTVPFPVGALIEIAQMGTGQVTIGTDTTATVNLRSRGGLLKTAGQYAAVSLRKIAADEWLVVGDLA